MNSLPIVSAADYARAESFLPWNVAQRIFNAEVRPHWLSGGERFWYRRAAREGASFLLVDTASGASRPAFDPVRLAAALSGQTGPAFLPTRLPFESISFSADQRAIHFDVGEQTWTCDLSSYHCRPVARDAAGTTEVRSPDGRWGAFVREHNLWVRVLASGEEIQLSTDGAQHNAYAAQSGAALCAVTDKLIGRPVKPAVLWSPDSSRLVTYRLDECAVREQHLLQAVPSDGSARPVLHSYRMPLPGDAHLPLGQLVVVDLVAGTLVPIQAPALNYFVGSPFDARHVWWSAEGARLYVLSAVRGGHSVELHVANPGNGAARLLIQEQGPTFVYPHHVRLSNSNVHDIGAGPSLRGGAIVWFSQRDGWGHLYLHDQDSGARLLQLTQGAWTVRDVQRVDAGGGWIYFTAGGREPGRDPYYRHLYRVRFDGTDLSLLTPEDADHTITFAPDGAHFLDTHSRVDMAPVTLLRTADGALLATLEVADISGLTELGWQPPERFVVKARDGSTDLHGTLFRPSHFDPAKRYPVLDSIYPGPQKTRVPKSFAGSEQGALGARNVWQDQAIAELGFLVVNIDGLGTPFRSKAFVDLVHGKNFGEAGGLTDHVAGLRQLAARDASLDLERVGIFGHSAGGFAAARAMFLFPDFFKVGIASAGNHDQLGYWANWGEFYIGMPDTGNYAGQDNMACAAQLRGKLLLIHGELDDNVHPGLSLRLADALIAANKDFDFLTVPFANHDYFDLRWGLEAAQRHISFSHPYVIRRLWDYLVTHLLGATPPAGFAIQPAHTVKSATLRK